MVVRKDVVSAEAQHAERWSAFRLLEANSKQNESFAAALRAFWDLGVSDEVPEHVREGAAAIVVKAHKDAKKDTKNDSKKDAVKKKEAAADLQRVIDVLMRFHSNQFGFENGTKEYDGTGGGFVDKDYLAAALFAHTSRLNHSCAPSLAKTTKQWFCESRRIKFNFGTDAGFKLLYARRDLTQGERLTINYGPEEMTSWPLEERRKLLRERLAFVCGCERCIAEEAAAAAGVELIGEDAWQGFVCPKATPNEQTDGEQTGGVKGGTGQAANGGEHTTAANGAGVEALEEVEEVVEEVDEAVPDFAPPPPPVEAKVEAPPPVARLDAAAGTAVAAVETSVPAPASGSSDAGACGGRSGARLLQQQQWVAIGVALAAVVAAAVAVRAVRR